MQLSFVTLSLDSFNKNNVQYLFLNNIPMSTDLYEEMTSKIDGNEHFVALKSLIVQNFNGLLEQIMDNC